MKKLTDWLLGKIKQEKYARFIKYMLSGTVAALIELGLFVIFCYVFLVELPVALNIGISNVISRVGSSYINYEMNRKYVFGSKNRDSLYLLKYSIVWIIQLGLSYGIIYALNLVGVEPWISKFLSDQVLGFASYQTQLYWVFKKE